MNAMITAHDGGEDYEQVGARLAAARRAAGLSQTDVGRLLGIPQSRVAKLEAGDRRLQYLEAFEYAELYGVVVEAFRAGS